MVAQFDYQLIANVLDSWEDLRRIPNYEKAAGGILFQHFFTNVPEAKILFGFPADISPDSEQLLKSPAFETHARQILGMFSQGVDMLGLDEDILSDLLQGLGDRHVSMGVKPEHFKPLGESLKHALKEMIGDKYTKETEKAWTVIYDAMAKDMVISMKKHTKKQSR